MKKNILSNGVGFIFDGHKEQDNKLSFIVDEDDGIGISVYVEEFTKERYEENEPEYRAVEQGDDLKKIWDDLSQDGKHVNTGEYYRFKNDRFKKCKVEIASSVEVLINFRSPRYNHKDNAKKYCDILQKRITKKEGKENPSQADVHMILSREKGDGYIKPEGVNLWYQITLKLDFEYYTLFCAQVHRNDRNHWVVGSEDLYSKNQDSDYDAYEGQLYKTPLSEKIYTISNRKKDGSMGNSFTFFIRKKG